MDFTTHPPVTSEVEMLALSVKQGDVCVREDINCNYVNMTGCNESMNDWHLMSTANLWFANGTLEIISRLYVVPHGFIFSHQFDDGSEMKVHPELVTHDESGAYVKFPIVAEFQSFNHSKFLRPNKLKRVYAFEVSANSKPRMVNCHRQSITIIEPEDKQIVFVSQHSTIHNYTKLAYLANLLKSEDDVRKLMTSTQEANVWALEVFLERKGWMITEFGDKFELNDSYTRLMWELSPDIRLIVEMN